MVVVVETGFNAETGFKTTLEGLSFVLNGPAFVLDKEDLQILFQRYDNRNVREEIIVSNNCLKNSVFNCGFWGQRRVINQKYI